MKIPYKKLLLFVLLSAVLCLGCTTMYNSATGRNEFIMISTTEEVQMGRNIHETIMSQNRVSTDRELVSRINKIGQRLARISDRQDYTYNFFVIESDELNAFTVPGGNIYIYTGLIKKLTTDDQIAFVLAHEMGHCAARHTTKKFQAAMGYNLIGNILLSRVQEGSMRQVASLSSGAIMNLVFSAYGRHDEYEADRLGVKYLYLAGYDPQAAMESLGVLQREMQNDRSTPLILRSHPYLDDRIEAVKKEIASGQSKFSKKT
jgi:predicted Zn-dependent protease